MKRHFIKKPVLASSRSIQNQQAKVSDALNDVMSEMTHQIWDSYNYSDNVSRRYIVSVWLEHLQEIYLPQDSGFAEDEPELYQELSKLSNQVLTQIGNELYSQYEWDTLN